MVWETVWRRAPPEGSGVRSGRTDEEAWVARVAVKARGREGVRGVKKVEGES